MKSNTQMNLVERADAFAEAAHASIDHRRMYGGEPYIVHPREVVQILRKFAVNPVTEEMLAAALLHDTVEDTPATIEQIRDEFGDLVADLVSDLTDVAVKSDGNRKARMEINLTHTAAASAEAHTIKCADIVSNAPGITANNPGFARKWLAEAEAKLAVCGDADPGLLAEAQRVWNECVNQLKGNK